MRNLFFSRSWKTQNEAGQPGPALQDSGGGEPILATSFTITHVTQTTTAVSTRPLGATKQVSAEPQRRQPSTSTLPGILFASEDRNLVLAYVFCICLGYLGAHRFYLVHIGMGILYVFTIGFFGWMVHRHIICPIWCMGINAACLMFINFNQCSLIHIKFNRRLRRHR